MYSRHRPFYYIVCNGKWMLRQVHVQRGRPVRGVVATAVLGRGAALRARRHVRGGVRGVGARAAARLAAPRAHQGLALASQTLVWPGGNYILIGLMKHMRTIENFNVNRFPAGTFN